MFVRIIILTLGIINHLDKGRGKVNKDIVLIHIVVDVQICI